MFFNMTAGQIVGACWIVIALLGLWGWRNVLISRRKAREADQKAREEYNKEADRIEKLPKLHTSWLMRVPASLMDKNPIRRSYGTRWNRMLIIDEY